MLHDRTTDDLGKVLFVKTGEHTSVIYGTHYPNRLFVGCLPPEAGAEDLGSFFSTFGNVVEAKVVLDPQGRSKRFGFITFSNPEDVESLICGGEVYFQGKKINVGPAVKKNLDSETTAKPVAKPAKPQAGVTVPQHTPKTIIRRSPVEQQQQQVPFDGQNDDEQSFRLVWGISAVKNSIWAPLKEEEKQEELPTQENTFSFIWAPLKEEVKQEQLPTQEKSFSFYQQLLENNNHTHCPSTWYQPPSNLPACNNLARVPPGFEEFVFGWK